MFLAFHLCITNVRAQNAYKFVEPNISLSFDSTVFKISHRYSNTTSETEAYDFSYNDIHAQGNIHVAAFQPVKYPEKKLLDSLLLSDLNEMKQRINDTLRIVEIDFQVRTVESFSCIGLVGYDKINNDYGTMIKCFHFSPDDRTEIVLISNEKKLDSSYSLLSGFLSGFKSYSIKEIENEERMIQEKYSVSVTQMKRDGNDSSATYKALVKINEPLTNKVIEATVRTRTGKQVFLPDTHQQITITLKDTNKGKILKHGEVILLNYFGKRVKVPFNFSYSNN